MACDLSTIGRITAIGLFAADDCLAPVYGPDMGYVDDCATLGGLSPEDEDTRNEFLRACPNGDIRAYVPARTVTKYVEASADFPVLPVEFLAGVGLVEPIMQGGEIVGWADCDTPINLIMVIWQEMISDTCGDSGAAGAPAFATVHALRDVRVTEDGDRGTPDHNFRLVGKSVRSGQLGSGPIPLFYDSDTPTVAVWPESCLPTCTAKGITFKAANPPVECGLMDTVAPPVPCVVAS